MGVCGGRWVGGVEGGRIRLQNGQIHEFDQHYKVLLVTKFIFFEKFAINIMFSCSALTSLS